jgi:hypothetical protein
MISPVYDVRGLTKRETGNPPEMLRRLSVAPILFNSSALSRQMSIRRSSGKSSLMKIIRQSLEGIRKSLPKILVNCHCSKEPPTGVSVFLEVESAAKNALNFSISP